MNKKYNILIPGTVFLMPKSFVTLLDKYLSKESDGTYELYFNNSEYCPVNGGVRPHRVIVKKSEPTYELHTLSSYDNHEHRAITQFDCISKQGWIERLFSFTFAEDPCIHEAIEMNLNELTQYAMSDFFDDVSVKPVTNVNL